jgi:hypothetical protein
MFSIQFDFDPETSEITNLRVVKVGEQVDDAIVTLDDNKLILSKSAQLLLGVIPNDRITVSYYTVSPEETFPVIGKSELFTDSNGGNRLTKSNTVSFRGTQREILLEYGKSFKLEPFKSYFKMVKLEEESDNDNLGDEELDLENLK